MNIAFLSEIGPVLWIVVGLAGAVFVGALVYTRVLYPRLHPPKTIISEVADELQNSPEMQQKYREQLKEKLKPEMEKQMTEKADLRAKQEAERMVWGKKGKPQLDTNGKPKPSGFSWGKTLNTLAKGGGNAMANIEADYNRTTGNFNRQQDDERDERERRRKHKRKGEKKPRSRDIFGYFEGEAD